MSYRNQHQLHRSDQVWNRDIRHSDEEDYRTPGSASAYSPGYSSRNNMHGSSAPQGSDYGSYNSAHRDRYEERRNSRDRWNDDFDRPDFRHNRQSDYTRGNQYDYNSGELRDHRDYDRQRYSSGYNGYGNYGYDNYGNSGSNYDRYRNDRYDRSRDDNDRGWWERTKDKVSSWFGDDDDDRREDRRMSHRGKGPKGYQRSDERIREDVSDRLSDDDRVDASDIDIEVNGCEVILKGSVTTRAEKRRAEDIAESVSGVKNVENRLRCTNPNGGINMNRYTGTTGEMSGIGSSSGTTSEIQRDVQNSRNQGW